MAATYLRDADGKLIGTLRQQAGNMRLFNKIGKLMGTYNPKTNITTDASGSVVARCNILVSLLKN